MTKQVRLLEEIIRGGEKHFSKKNKAAGLRFAPPEQTSKQTMLFGQKRPKLEMMYNSMLGENQTWHVRANNACVKHGGGGVIISPKSWPQMDHEIEQWYQAEQQIYHVSHVHVSQLSTLK